MTRKAKVESEPKKSLSLGTKRACPKCGAKFYDFRKDEGECPKCGTHINFQAQQAAILTAVTSAPKKPKPKPAEEEETTETIPTAGEDFESLEELGDAEEDASLEDLEVDEDEKEGDY